MQSNNGLERTGLQQSLRLFPKLSKCFGTQLLLFFHGDEVPKALCKSGSKAPLDLFRVAERLQQRTGVPPREAILLTRPLSLTDLHKGMEAFCALNGL